MPRSNCLEYSVIIPAKNEVNNLARLLDEVHDTMASMGQTWELICIDDGSSDGSYELLLQLKKSHPQLRLIKMGGNFGQSAALKVGMDNALGRWLITLDADLQNDPRDIPHLCELKEQRDLICGWRAQRQDTWQKRWISKGANAIRSRICDDGVHDTGCSLKLMRADIAKKLFWFRGAHRFIPALFKLHGGCVAEVKVHHRARFSGTSNYHLFNRGLAPIMDLLAFIWLRRRHLNYRVEHIDEPRA